MASNPLESLLTQPRQLFTAGRRAGKSFLTRQFVEALSGEALLKASKTADTMIIDEFNKMESVMAATKEESVKTPADEKMEALAKEMSERFGDNKFEVTLLSPGNLTVSRPGKGYSKENHIGGEQFLIRSCYVGKRGKFNFVFEPMAASNYTTMEMDLVQANSNLSGFNEHLDFAADGNFTTRMSAIRTEIADENERAASKDKFVEYQEIGFGSW